MPRQHKKFHKAVRKQIACTIESEAEIDGEPVRRQVCDLSCFSVIALRSIPAFVEE